VDAFYRPNPLVYPAGRTAGFNPYHPAVRGMVRFCGVAGTGGTFYNLTPFRVGTKVGTTLPTTTIDGIIGPCYTSVAASAAEAEFAFTGTFSETTITMAAIFFQTSATGAQFLISTNGGSTNTGVHLNLSSGNFTFTIPGVNDFFSGFVGTIGHQYFYAASLVSTTLINHVIVDLSTGKVSAITTTAGTPGAAVNQIIGIGNDISANAGPFVGGIAAAMYGAYSLSMNELLRWAADPWSFWYPNPDENWVGVTGRPFVSQPYDVSPRQVPQYPIELRTTAFRRNFILRDTMTAAFCKESYDLPLGKVPFRPDFTFINPAAIKLIGNDLMTAAFRKESYDLAPGQVPSREPNLRTWIESFQPGSVPPPINQEDWPVPRGYPPLIKSWEGWYNLNLIGQDAMPSSFRKEVYDLTPGQIPSREPNLRTWIESFQPGSVMPPPQGEVIYDLPAPRPYQFDLRTWVSPSQRAVAAPFAQYDWPLPRAYPRPDETWAAWYNFNLIGQDRLPAGKQISDRPPVPPWYRDWALFPLTAFPAGPLPSYDWQIPPSMVGPSVDLRTWIGPPQQAVTALPFKQVDWPNPIAAKYQNDLRTWVESFQPGSVMPPVNWDDWPLPRTYPRLDHTWAESYNLNLIGKDQLPTGKQVSDRPPPVSWYRDWAVNLQQSSLFVSTTPFAQYDWPLFRAPPRLDQTWTFSYNLNLIGKDQLPTGKQVSDRPPPVSWYRDWAINLQQSTLGAVFKPFAQYDWPLFRAPPRLDQTWTQSYNLNLIGQDQLPVGEISYERTPRAPAGKWDYVFVSAGLQTPVVVAVFPPGESVYDLPPRSYPPPGLTWSQFPFTSFTFVAAAGPLPSYDWQLSPSMVGPSADLYTWTRSYNLNLIGQDQLPTGEQVSDLVPRAYPPLIKSWEWWYNLNLIGQDRLPPGELVFDRPATVPWYRDWPITPNQITVPPSPFGRIVTDLAPRAPSPLIKSWEWSYNINLIGKDRLPAGSQVYELPQRAPDPLVRSWAEETTQLFTLPPSIPFLQRDWPLPGTYPRLDQTWVRSYNLNLIGQDRLPVRGKIYDIPPQGALGRNIFIFVSRGLRSPSITALFFAQHDWPLPGRYPRLEQTWVHAPFNEPSAGPLPSYDWQVPPSMVGPSIDLRTWTQAVTGAFTTPPAQIPFLQFDWPLPGVSPPLVKSWEFWFNLNLITAGQFPVGEQIFERPAIPAPLIPYQPQQNILLQSISIVPPPFLQFDWPLPGTYPRLQQTWTAFYNRNLIAQDQLLVGEQVYDRPPPVTWYRDWSSPPTKTAVTQFPFTQTDWPLPIRLAPWYRDWSLNLQPGTLGPLYMPSRVVDMPPPTGYPRLDQTWAFFPNVPPIPNVTRISDLPPRGYPPLIKSWEWSYNLNLISKDQLPIGEQVFELPQRAPPPVVPSWAQETTSLVTFVPPIPFLQRDWPLPGAYPRLDQTWAKPFNINLIGKDVLPVGEIVYELPQRAPAPLIRVWVSGPVFSLPGGIPFLQFDWPLPGTYPRLDQSWSSFYNRNLIGKDVLPPGELVYELPQRAPAPLVPAWYWTYNLNLIAKDRLPVGSIYTDRPPPVNWLRHWDLNLQGFYRVFVKPTAAMFYDLPPRGYPPPVPSLTFSYELSLIGRDILPRGKIIYDTPAQKPRLPDLVNWYWSYNLNLIGRDRFPAGQHLFDLAPRGAIPTLPLLQTWEFRVRPPTIIAHPISQYDWPLPRRQPLFPQPPTFVNKTISTFPIVLGDLTLIANQSLNYFGIHDTYSSTITQIFLIMTEPAQQNPQMIFQRPDGSTFIEQFPYVSVGQFTMNTPKGLAVAGHYLVYNVVKSRFTYPGVWRAFAKTDGPGANFYVRNY
jgi:hypothetical protein